LVALLALCACSAPPYEAWAIEDDAEAVAQVVVTEMTLQDVVRAGRPLVERVQPDEYLRVVVPVRNIDTETIQVLAQMSFLDGQRQTLMDDTNRQVLVLPPGGTTNFQATSRTRNAADFLLRLSWNK
jgi:hypothetical protein